MKTLSNEEINEIRLSVDIVDVVSRYISLTKKGKNYFGVCPFHEDGDPSLSVSPDKQIFSCFSCHTAGNVFKFLMEYEHISFIEAVKMVADISGINIDVQTFKNTNVKQNKIYDVYDIGQKFYVNNINTQFGKNAKEYLINRGINEEMIKEFEIGLAIKSTNTLSKLLEQKDFKENDLTDSGLIVKDEKGFHDFFYDRVMFPLHDINGKVIGYSGRIYYKDDNAPKYINSKEHPLFKKGEFVYNYQRAKNECRIKNTVIIMEGFMDVIRAYSVGVKNVVATLGTAFTKEHANLIKKLAKNIIICFDGDKAGAKATMACSNILISMGIIPKIVRLEENLDPDEYVLKYGKDKFIDKINNPMSVMDFKLNFLKNDKDLTQTVDKAKYATEMLEELNKINDDVLREVTLNKISKETDLDIEFLKSKLDVKVEVKVKPKPTIKSSTCDMAQLMILFYMLRYKEVIKMVENKSIYFPNKDYRLLSREIISFYKTHSYIDIAEILGYLDDEMTKTIGLIESLELKDEYTQDMIDECLKTIRNFNIDNEYERIFKQLETETDFEKKKELGQRINELLIRREEDV